ncbi:MAG: PAS-domain containing protein [Litoreibacter sp.]
MSLINPHDSLERQNEKLLQITQSLMRRVEQKSEQSGLAYQQFERAALLETQVRDRTRELERTLDLLQESNARLELANDETEAARANLTEAIETVSEGFALFDPDDRLVLYNSRFCRDLLDIVPDLSAGLAFSDYVSLIAKSRCLALPSDQTPQAWSVQRLEHHRDDHVVFNVSLIWDRWLQVSEHRTARGGTVILQTDVTDIIRLERLERDKMRDQQARMLQATLDHLNQGITIFDHKQTLVGWNSRMDGLMVNSSLQANKGVKFTDLVVRLSHELTFHPGFDADQLNEWANRTIDRRPIAFEVTRGDEQVFSVFAQEMPDRGFVISFTDVTAEREAARALSQMNEQLERHVQARTAELGEALSEAERANASKSRFVAAASHDLLQPLSAAKLFVSSLTDRTIHEDTLSVIRKAETALVSVETIIEALLDISKLDAGKAVFDIQPVRLSAILTPLRDELTPIALSKGLDLRILDSDLSVLSDPGYLRRIIQNLLSNAIRYTDHGRVLLGTRRRRDTLRIEVWDTGRGIAETDQSVIFQEFRRIDAQRSDNGLGLGLTIVERACKGLGHPLSLWSEPNQGSCFSLCLPLHVTEAKASRSIPRNISGDEPHFNDLIVMLVENDKQFASAVIMMIEACGAEVIHAEDAQSAKQLLRDIQLVPDAMLVDYQLGAGLTGTQLFQHIGAEFGPVPTAIVSANRTQQLRSECRDLGIPLISKPLEKQRLWDFLTEVSSHAVRHY